MVRPPQARKAVLGQARAVEFTFRAKDLHGRLLLGEGEMAIPSQSEG